MKTAAASVNKGNPSTFYSGEKTNPVLRALEQDTKSYVNYMKKRAAIATGKLPANESNESSCRQWVYIYIYKVDLPGVGPFVGVKWRFKLTIIIMKLLGLTKI